MSFGQCPKCGAYTNIALHKCEEFEVRASVSIDYIAEDVSE